MNISSRIWQFPICRNLHKIKQTLTIFQFFKKRCGFGPRRHERAVARQPETSCPKASSAEINIEQASRSISLIGALLPSDWLT